MMAAEKPIEQTGHVAISRPLSKMWRGAFWPLAFSVIFLAIPLVLFAAYPYSFWVGNDYQPLGLADALNLAYRIGDRHFYYARGMTGHPGVPFYFMNWLALALSGFPAATMNPAFFDIVLANIDVYHRFTVWLAAAAGATGVFLFTWSARSVAPLGVVALGLLVWLASTPATLQTILFPSIDAFALLINGLFFSVLVRVANDRDVMFGNAVLAGSVGAFAYLNKLSYVYVPLALAVVGILNFALRGVELNRARLLSVIFVGTLVAVVTIVGFTVIGLPGFRQLLSFHLQVLVSSGLYGAGDHTLVSGPAVWKALVQIPSDKSYAILIALLGGAALGIGSLILGLRRKEHLTTALIGVGAGAAATLSAVFVLKHYEAHYTAGVSATLPACFVAGYRLAKSWGFRFTVFGTLAAFVLSAFMAYLVNPTIISSLSNLMKKAELARADLRDINAQTTGNDRTVEFAYRTPFSWYSEGFVVFYASIPRLTIEYPQIRPSKISSITDEVLHRNVGAYVIDKDYFPTVESVKAASNVALLGPQPVKFEDGDKLIELRTVFLLIKGR